VYCRRTAQLLLSASPPMQQPRQQRVLLPLAEQFAVIPETEICSWHAVVRWLTFLKFWLLFCERVPLHSAALGMGQATMLSFCQDMYCWPFWL
jgi:hypothetical protein